MKNQSLTQWIETGSETVVFKRSHQISVHCVRTKKRRNPSNIMQLIVSWIWAMGGRESEILMIEQLFKANLRRVCGCR